MKKKFILPAGAGVAALSLLLTGCGNEGDAAGGAGGPGEILTVGTTDKITSIDPAASYDNGSFTVISQSYAFLLRTPYGTSEVQPSLAESASFTKPTEYTVKLKPGLKFANGHALTASDVKFSFDRIKRINKGPVSLLENLESVSTPDDLTVVFKLKLANDQVFPQVLSSPAGPIVDEEVFPADKPLEDDEIVAKKPFAGQYIIESYKKNELVQYKPNPDYKGILGAARNSGVTAKYYSSAANLKLDISKNNIDLATRSLSSTDIADLRKDPNVVVHNGTGGEIRYIVFNFDTQPHGAKQPDANPEKALAVRQAAAHIVNRKELSEKVYQGTYTPLYSYVPSGLPGATTPLKDLYGDGQGGPDVNKAKETLQKAGVTTPVKINLQYSNDHYGPSSADEYARIKDQLEKDGLFQVTLATTEWGQYLKDKNADLYPVYQLGWFPDYSDADTYLTPFFGTKTFIKNHFDNKAVQELVGKQLSEPDKEKRKKIIGEIQSEVAKHVSTLPLLQGSQIAVTGKDVEGVKDTLDASFRIKYGALSKKKK